MCIPILKPIVGIDFQKCFCMLVRGKDYSVSHNKWSAQFHDAVIIKVYNKTFVWQKILTAFFAVVSYKMGLGGERKVGWSDLILFSDFRNRYIAADLVSFYENEIN